jgi:integrase/recombinase XerD
MRSIKREEEGVTVNLSPAARELVSLIRRHRLNYDTLRTTAFQARRHLGLKPPRRGRTLPKLLTESDLQKFFDSVDAADNLQHAILLRLLLYTGVRVAELCTIKVSDVDLDAGKIFIESGKGDRDRYVLFGEQFRLPLRTYMATHRENVYLFESKYKAPFTTRWIHMIVAEYGQAAGIDQAVHPHLFRHAILTHLTRSGVSDAQIQLVSGHVSKKSLERYQHLALSDVKQDYETAVRKLPQGI